MAWLEKRGDLFRIKYRYGGRHFQHPLKTGNEREANACLARLEENLRLLVRGKMELPEAGEDLSLYLLSDGKRTAKPVIDKTVTLAQLFDRYRKLPEGIKEGNTRYTEEIHMAHLERLLGAKTAIRAVSCETLQRYVDARSAEQFRGKPLSHTTVRKEIGTFASIWNKFALPQHLVTGPCPSRALLYRKRKEKSPFQTWEQIERQIKRGGLTAEEIGDLWDSLFLTMPEVGKLLAFVKEQSQVDFLHPMFVFAAHTGARRSEMLRSEVEDFDFQAGLVKIREKKKDRTVETTFRHVPISPLLRKTMKEWFKVHPGGRFTICKNANEPLTVQLAAHHLRWLLDGTVWKTVKGWHVLRHSFISNAVARGVDQRILDHWVGHSTEAMRRRYTHLIPSASSAAMELIFWKRA